MTDLNSWKVALKKWRSVNCPCKICKVDNAKIFFYQSKYDSDLLLISFKLVVISLSFGRSCCEVFLEIIVPLSNNWSLCWSFYPKMKPFTISKAPIFQVTRFLVFFPEDFKFHFAIVIFNKLFFGSWHQLACLLQAKLL